MASGETDFDATRGGGRVLLAGAIAAAALIALLPSFAEAATKRPSLSVRLTTGTQAQAVRPNRLRGRVRAGRGTRVTFGAVARRAKRSLGVVRPATVSRRRGKGR